LLTQKSFLQKRSGFWLRRHKKGREPSEALFRELAPKSARWGSSEIPPVAIAMEKKPRAGTRSGPILKLLPQLRL
jgi:hypothetical protein